MELNILAGALAASSVMVGLAGNRLHLPGGLELSRGSEEILNRTGKKFGNEIVHQTLKQKIIQANLDMRPEYFTGLQYALPVMILVALAPLSWPLKYLDFYWAAMLAVLAYFLPGVWLNSKVKKRVGKIKAEMPIFCTLFSTAMSSGADIRQALDQVSRVMDGELAKEIRKALQDMATGDNRATALNKMANRCGVEELNSLVRMIIQASRYGGGNDLSAAVKHHVDKMMLKQKQEVQKTAGELSIKLLPIIIVFIISTLFVLLFFPVIWIILTTL